ncbi:hypothetical protein [Streptomyces sp. DSM 40750]|uniref:hypothetical protein n=1 Tax=Streptomyces sp. DSM 40750 TaxID=2801030 RepID=UPI00214B855F|nr:hypothetical protein [Streptomyces sp. DSM 40750]UUU26512.1 hypothetical protein JIX55_43360 [Streptomyces sp. DSM 40750]
MNVRNRRRSLATLGTAILLGSCLALAPGVAQAQSPAAAPQGLCTHRDGYPPDGGTNMGGTPSRYQWRNTPYVGARFDGCTDTLKLYYGGYSRPGYSYYEVRYTNEARHGWRTWQLPMGERRVSTIEGPAHGSWNFKVRACASSIDDAQGARPCTGWSPQLFLYAN